MNLTLLSRIMLVFLPLITLNVQATTNKPSPQATQPKQTGKYPYATWFTGTIQEVSLTGSNPYIGVNNMIVSHKYKMVNFPNTPTTMNFPLKFAGYLTMQKNLPTSTQKGAVLQTTMREMLETAEKSLKGRKIAIRCQNAAGCNDNDQFFESPYLINDLSQNDFDIAKMILTKRAANMPTPTPIPANPVASAPEPIPVTPLASAPSVPAGKQLWRPFISRQTANPDNAVATDPGALEAIKCFQAPQQLRQMHTATFDGILQGYNAFIASFSNLSPAQMTLIQNDPKGNLLMRELDGQYEIIKRQAAYVNKGYACDLGFQVARNQSIVGQVLEILTQSAGAVPQVDNTKKAQPPIMQAPQSNEPVMSLNEAIRDAIRNSEPEKLRPLLSQLGEGDLDLSNLGLRPDVLIPWLNLHKLSLENIRSLNLAQNRLTTLKDLDQIAPNLQNLNIGGNQLKSLQGIKGLTKLVNLYAQNNFLGTNTDAGALAEAIPESVQDLVLDNNKFKGAVPKLAWPNLKRLTLNENPELTAVCLPNAFRFNPGTLEMLEVRNTNLDSFSIDCLKLTRKMNESFNVAPRGLLDK